MNGQVRVGEVAEMDMAAESEGEYGESTLELIPVGLIRIKKEILQL